MTAIALVIWTNYNTLLPWCIWLALLGRLGIRTYGMLALNVSFFCYRWGINPTSYTDKFNWAFPLIYCDNCYVGLCYFIYSKYTSNWKSRHLDMRQCCMNCTVARMLTLPSCIHFDIPLLYVTSCPSYTKKIVQSSYLQAETSFYSAITFLFKYLKHYKIQ